jgi:hypothetical protein
MKSSNVVSLDDRRHASEMNSRMAQNSLILIAAISDPRLNRDDLKLLAKVLDSGTLYGLLRHHYEPENKFIVRSINKLTRSGYLTVQVEELMIGFRSHINRVPEPFWVFELTKRERTRSWT